MKKTLISLAFLLGAFLLLLSSCADKDHVHQFEYITVQSTCTSIGYTEARCACGKIEHNDFTALSVHVEGEWEMLNTVSCENDAERVKYCINCNTILKRETVQEKLGHKGGEFVTVEASSCNKSGKQEKRCIVCDKVLETIHTDLSEHEYEKTYVTDNNIRYEVFTCKICDDVYKNQINADNTPNDIYNMITDATVLIYANDTFGNRISIGSGFFITSDGNIATNYHVIKGAYTLEVITKQNAEYSVKEILGYDEKNDIAILKIDKNNTPYIVISNDEIKTGDAVYTLGSPLGLFDTFSSGIISNPSKKVNGKDCIQFTSPISPGNSGGPLVNEYGKVIGINTMVTAEGQNLNFAVKASLIRSVNKENPISPEKLYQNKLSENALDIIKNHICAYASSVDVDKYIFIGTESKESDYGYGTEPYLIYDEERNLLSMTVYLVSDNKYRFAIEMVFGLDEEYYVSLFDYDKNQVMITSLVKTGAVLGDYDKCFDKAFTVIRNRYNPKKIISSVGGVVYTEQDAAQVVLYQSYQTLVEQFAIILKQSNTGLTLERFGLVMPER